MNTVTPAGKKRKTPDDDIDNAYSSSMLRVSGEDTPSRNTRSSKRRRPRVADVHSSSKDKKQKLNDAKPPYSSTETMNRIHDKVDKNSEVSGEVSSPSSFSSSSSLSSCHNSVPKHVIMPSIQKHAITLNNDSETRPRQQVSPEAIKDAATREGMEINMNRRNCRDRTNHARIVTNNTRKSLPSIGEEPAKMGLDADGNIARFEEEEEDYVINPECNGKEWYDESNVNVTFTPPPSCSRTRKFCKIIFKSCLCSSILVYAVAIAHKTYTQAQDISNRLQIKLHESEVNLERALKAHSLTMNELTAVSNELGHANTLKKVCATRLETTTRKFDALRDENQALVQKRSNLEQRLDSMVGAEGDIQKALANAYQTQDDINRELEELDTAYRSCDASLSQALGTVSTLTEEGQDYMHRIVDLELYTVDLGTKLEEYQKKIRIEEERNQLLRNQIAEAQDSAALLQHQLVEEDGRSWYYELQLQHLEDMGEAQENALSDLKYENDKLRDEIRQLKDTLDQQLEGGIAALNAVARSATRRKKEQFHLVEIGADRRVEQAKMEAVNAIHSVLSAKSNGSGWK